MINNSGKIYIGQDNGTTGTLSIFVPGKPVIFLETPCIKIQDYTKAKNIISRIDVKKYYELLQSNIPKGEEWNSMALLERPLVNPKFWKATISAVRCYESQITVLETLGIPYSVIDSKEWQKQLLPSGISGTPELKAASVDVGCRLFPYHSDLIKKHKDADGLLIGLYALRSNL